ncbi:MAG: DNA mismatch repair endonuclease MutL [Muribaculaceae bacterium]|nr:DNA mismatch repair endonuclease MutL [Muribaculaceae bacterium]
MADVIKLLPDAVANQIAAGEVIQRPASVLKELVENAVDAGATEIQIVIKDAGRTLIQVVDNGRGMSPTDARLAFERHATSKIRAASDLFGLHTMGFRGEALPSICAISQVELRTMGAGETLGTRLLINGSRVETQEPCVCTPGSNFMVKNLFFNTPARRKFLKSDSVELGALMREFERLALVNCDIRFSIDTGHRHLELRAASFKQRIADLWKNNLNMQLLPIEIDTSLVRISGFVSRPEFARRRNPLQYLIVNGRNMRHPYFHKAILSTYEGIIAQDTQPCYFLRFEVDPATIDVNIHPTKNEIKFEHEAEIRPILTAAVRAAIGKFTVAPSIDFTQEVMPLEPARDGEYVKAPDSGVDLGYNPFRSAPPAAPPGSSRPRGQYSHADVTGWESLYTGFMNDTPDAPEPPAASDTEAQQTLPLKEENLTPICVQCGLKYILTPAAEGVMVIDQHRAHVRILYERYMRESAGRGAISAIQRVMFAESLSLDAMQQSIFDGIRENIERLGFAFTRDGDDWRITGVPAALGSENARDVVLNIIDSVADENPSYGSHEAPDAESLRRRVALLTARASAIRRGQTLTAAEMEHLIGELFSLPDAALTPEGNPIVRVLPESALAALFT